MKCLLALILAVLLSGPWSATAQGSRPAPEDRHTDARLKQLSLELRCLVCQNQSLADSHAPLAEDLRAEIRRMMSNGLSDEEIVEFLVSRYGDFVLYRPPLKGTTWLLWFGPFFFLVSGFAVLGLALWRRRRHPPDPAVSGDKHRLPGGQLSEEQRIP